MSLYNHVANKEEILDGMVDAVVSEIEAPANGADWKAAMRGRVLSARLVLMRHPWAPRVIESRTRASPTVMKYMDSILGILFAGGFSTDLAHHALHALGSRILGFTQELYDDSGELDESPAVAAIMLQQMTAVYPHISTMVSAISHDEQSVLGQGCDDQVEFEFALDLILDGLQRLRDQSDA
jgi:AcrR family transcriptional regulator